MNEAGQYPPPDFGTTPNSIQVLQQQQQPRSSSFHPNMWTWSETPSEPNCWGYGNQAGWHHVSAGGSGLPPGHVTSRPPYGQNFGNDWYHHGGGQSHGYNRNYEKKQRTKKEPEYSQFCDTCDRGFKNQEKYDEHISQHVKCSVPDCNFTAHEKIVSIHWKNNHAPGTKRIKLDTPEDIAKWREERRKNYPTLQNIEKKKKVMEARNVAGSVLETAQFGRMRGRGRGRGRGKGRGRGWCNRGFQERHPHGSHPLDSSATERSPPLSRPCRDSDPLGALASSDHDSDREDVAAESRTSGLVVPPKKMSAALGSLVANYGSSTESESDGEPETIPIQKAKNLLRENQRLLDMIPPKSQEGGSNKNMEHSTVTNTVPEKDCALNTPNNKRGRGGHRGRGGRGGHQIAVQKNRPTLLEMLLAPDIRHERNVLLQCVRYVVRNNFFLKSKPQCQEGMGSTAAITNGEHDGRHKKTSEEVVSQFVCMDGGGKAKSGTQVSNVVNRDDVDIGEAIVKSCKEQDLLSKVCSETSKDVSVDSVVFNELVGREFVQNTEDTAGSDCHSFHFKVTDKITSATNMYDDEIWEIPSSVM